MKCYIDRIEDGKFAVLHFYSKDKMVGEIVVEKDDLGIKIHEGAHLKVNFELDKESEQAARDRISDLQEQLLNRNKK